MTQKRHAHPFLATALAALVSAMVLSTPVSAQQVYRIVGPDGRVTFSDKPPQDASAKANTRPAPTVALPAAGAAGGGSLPFELRQVAAKFPVTLYTGNNCGPCGGGRAFLSARGIPFTEKTVNTNSDIEALQRLSGGAPSLPTLTIGGQQLKGYSETEWTSFLDAAGYPKTSALPPGFRQAAATPLIAVQPQPVAAAPAPADTPIAPLAPPPAAEAPSNPAGIRF